MTTVRESESFTFSARVPEPGDLGALMSVVPAWEGSARWSLRTLSPSPRWLESKLWGDVFFQLLYFSSAGEPVALCQLGQADYQNGHANLGIAAKTAPVNHLVEMLTNFNRTVFDAFPFRKLVTDVPVDQSRLSEAVRHVGQSAGKLLNHERESACSFIDVEVFELWRSHL